MAQPTPYVRTTDFSDHQRLHPTTPLPGEDVDFELDALRITLDSLLANLALIQRDDTALANASVGYDQLKAEVSLGFNPPEIWETDRQYIERDTCFEDSRFYLCAVSHVSDVFATDLASGKWTLLADFESVQTEAIAARDAAIVAQNAAAASATASATSATNSATSATASATSATNSATSATASATSATNAAASASTITGALSAFVSFQDPIIFDIEGVLTGSPVVFVPRQRFYWNGTTGALSTNGTESAVISGYVEVSVSSSTQTAIYYDSADTTTPYKAAVYPSGVPSSATGQYVNIAIMWSKHIQCAFHYETTDDWSGGRLVFRTPPVVDGAKLLVPAFYRWFPNSSTSMVFMSPADGSNYWELDISTTTTEDRRHYFDLTAALAGSTPVVTAIGTAVPRKGGGGRVHVFATSMNGRVTPAAGYVVAGGGNGGVARNEFDYALGDDPDLAPQVFTDTTLVDVTDPLLTTAGITRGFTALTTNRPYAGANIKDVRLGYYFFARARYVSTVDDTFATARIYLRNGTTVISTVNMTLEAELSNRVRYYSVSGQFPTSGTLPDNYIIGMENAAGSVTVVCGMQFGTSPDPVSWIARSDFTTANSNASIMGTVAPEVLADVTASGLAMGEDVWLTTGRPMPLFVQNLFPERTDGNTVTATLTSVKTSTALPWVISANAGQIMLDPTYLGATAALDVRHRAANVDRRYRRDLNIHIAPASGTGSPKILIIKDSLGNRGAGAWLNARLVAMGYTPTFLGTIIGKGVDDGDLTGVNGECREGARFSEHIYQTTGRPPFAAGTEATYLAKTKANKMLDMPFIRPTTGGDDPAHVFNGYIFDLGFYLTRFSLATPDVILIGLGTNDFAQGTPSESLDGVAQGLDAMITSCRAAAPSAHIGVMLHNMPRSSNGDSEWAERYAALKEHIRFVEAQADGNLHFVPVFSHMSSEVGWGDTLVSTDADTGTQVRDWSDQIHFLEFQRRVVAEIEASWIACRLNGI